EGSPWEAYARKNSYAPSMVSQRAAKSAEVALSEGPGMPPGVELVELTGRSHALGRFRGPVRTGHYPPARLVVLKVLPPRDPAEDHGLRDPPLLRTDCEVHVRDDEAHEPDARQSVRHVDDAPRPIAEQIRIAR